MKTEFNEGASHAQIEAIEHDGVVIHAGAGVVEVKLADGDDCGACPAAALCGIAGKSSGHTLRIPASNASDFKRGELVVVEGSETLHKKAIRIATIYPTLAILAVMVGLYLLTANQLVAALAGVATMLVFFGVLYACRRRLASQFVFSVKKKK